MKLIMLTQNGQYHRHILGKLLDIKGKENPLGIWTKSKWLRRKIRLDYHQSFRQKYFLPKESRITNKSRK